MKRGSYQLGDRLWRVHIPEGADYKGRKFVAHSLLTHAGTPEQAIDTIVWQVGYPEGLNYTVTEEYYDSDGDPINKAHGYNVTRRIPGRKREQPRGKGRERLDIPVNLICDALKNSKNEKYPVQCAARELGCSRGYIYKIITAEKVREIIGDGGE